MTRRRRSAGERKAASIEVPSEGRERRRSFRAENEYGRERERERRGGEEGRRDGGEGRANLARAVKEDRDGG